MDPQDQQSYTSDSNSVTNPANLTPQSISEGRFGVHQNPITSIHPGIQQASTGSSQTVGAGVGAGVTARSSAFSKLRFGRIAAALVAVVVIGLLAGFYFLFIADRSDQTANPSTIGKDFEVSQIPLSGLIRDGQISIDPAQQLWVNGQLRVNSSFVLAPSSEPQNPSTGQIYYNKTSNELFYFNGTVFVNLATSEMISNLGLGAFSNLSGVGDGLAIQGQTLANTGVLSVQGQSGAVTFTAGGGIGINGLTITNTGVTGLSGTANQISVSAANGNVTLALPQNISPSSTPTFAGVNLTSPLAVGSGGTGVTAFGTNSVIVSNGSGGLATTGSGLAGQCLRSNGAGVAPGFQACPGGGGSGDVVAGAQTSGQIVKWDAVANQIADSIMSESAGVITVNGSLSVTGTLSGNGSGLTGVNAAQLNGQTGSFYQNATNLNAGTLADARLSANVALLNGANSFTAINTFSNAGNSFTGSGAGLTGLNATNVSSGTLNDARLSANVTVQGNTFNGSSQLVQTTAGGLLPVLSGANLTNLNASNVSSGTLPVTFGGTGANSFAANGVLYGNATGAILATAAGSTGQCLMAGVGGVPAFQACPVGGSGNISSGTSQTPGTLTKFDTTTNQITDSLLSEAAGTVTASGNFTITGTPTLSALGAGILHSSAGGVVTSSAINLNSGDVTNTLQVGNGGTGSTTAAGARGNLGAAASGANSDITSLSGLTTALSVAQGGTGQTSFTDGQLLIGNTSGNTLTKATLTAGSGVTIVNGNGSITISAPGSGSCATCANVTLS
ncbi:MAG TPA: hypothetical protein VMR98_06070, partial [Candidatus Polarisedimenticolaceae bacterium]|nr:hypothetical protein [Candidatus Polarisedimenticolaceae bacterium]